MDYNDKFLNLVNFLNQKGVAVLTLEKQIGITKGKVANIRRGGSSAKKEDYQKLLMYIKEIADIISNEADIILPPEKSPDCLEYINAYHIEKEKRHKSEQKIAKIVLEIATESSETGLIEKIKAIFLE